MKLTAADVARLQALGDGWEGSEAPLTVSAADAAALGFPLDVNPKTGKPSTHATVKGSDLFGRTRDLKPGDDAPEPTPPSQPVAGPEAAGDPAKTPAGKPAGKAK